MTAPGLLTRCRAVLARLHATPVIPRSSVDADVLAELQRRRLVLVGSAHLTYSTAGSPVCANPSTFTLDHEPVPREYPPADVLRAAFEDAAGEERPEPWSGPELIRYNIERLIAADGRDLVDIAVAAWPVPDGATADQTWRHVETARMRLLRARKSGAARHLAGLARALGCKLEDFLREPAN
jgi:hypothetical protein